MEQANQTPASSVVVDLKHTLRGQTLCGPLRRTKEVGPTASFSYTTTPKKENTALCLQLQSRCCPRRSLNTTTSVGNTGPAGLLSRSLLGRAPLQGVPGTTALPGRRSAEKTGRWEGREFSPNGTGSLCTVSSQSLPLCFSLWCWAELTVCQITELS